MNLKVAGDASEAERAGETLHVDPDCCSKLSMFSVAAPRASASQRDTEGA